MATYYQQGPYRARIEGQGLSKSGTGNPQIFLRIMVLESLDVNPVTYNQYERTIYWTLTEKTVDFTLDKLLALGFSGSSFRQIDPDNAGHQSFVGNEIEVYCKLETYDGKEREKWDLSHVSGAAPEPLDESEARKLDALFGRKLKDKFGSSAPATAKKETVPPSGFDGPVDDDGIPF